MHTSSHHIRHPWLLALGAALLQLGTVLLAGWTWDALLWGAALWAGTLGLASAIIWGLAYGRNMYPFLRDTWWPGER